MNTRKSVGLRCKACDCHLTDIEFDGELCPECLSVVHDINKDYYGLNDHHPFKGETEDE